jgi:hypothetical protein
MKVNESTYENYFLLYIDNELTAAEKIAVETFVLTNPIYASVLQKLQQTKLPVTEVVYEDKALLYRFEEMEAALDTSFKQSLYRKEAVIIRPNFKKQYFAIATSVAALFILFLGYQNFQDKKGIVIKAMNTGLATAKKENQIKQSVLTENKTLQPSNIIEESSNVSFAANEKNYAAAILPESNVAAIVSAEVIANEQYTSSPISVGISETTYAETTNTIQPEVITEQITEYNEIDTDDNDRVVYIASFEVDTDKFRGITRKVGSLFKRNKTNKENKK